MDFILNVDPYPKGRPRLTKNGHAYTPEKTKKNERHLKYELRAKAERLMLDKPISLEIDFFIERPKSVPKKRNLPVVRPDIDNYLKQVMDAGNDYLWADDSCICEVIARKLYTSGKGYIHLRLKEITEPF